MGGGGLGSVVNVGSGRHESVVNAPTPVRSIDLKREKWVSREKAKAAMSMLMLCSGADESRCPHHARDPRCERPE